MNSNLKKTPEKQTLTKTNMNLTRPDSAKGLLEITRLKDNHWDPSVHNKPWIAPGKTPDYKYTYNDSGLGFEVRKGVKLAGHKDKFDLNKEIEERFRQFRRFREYENLRENEIIITIEYCTNCKDHANSTRHDEEKYYQFASGIKSAIVHHFPIAKVYLKPLIYDEIEIDQSIDNLYLQKRIGAFEIQLCARISQKTIEEIIFSKLNTKKWPSHEEVLEKITLYINKCDLIVILTLEEEDYDKKNGENKLKGISISLKPVREKPLQQQNPNTFLIETDKSMNYQKQNMDMLAFNKTRPESAIRPYSGYSTASNKTILSINKKINERQALINKQIKILSTDDNGAVIYKGIPYDTYEIEVPENNDFIGEKQIINIFEFIENDQMPIKVQIPLKKQAFAFCSINLVDKTDNMLSVLQAKIDVIESNSASKKAAFVQENPPRSGKYEIILDPGDYKFNIYKEGYEEISKIFSVKSGTNNLKIPLKKKNEGQADQNQLLKNPSPQQQKKNLNVNVPPVRPTSSKNILIIVFDAMTSQPLPNVNVQLEEQTTKKSTLYKTNQQGTCSISQQNIVEGKLIISDEKEEYFKIIEDYGPNKLNLYSMKDLSFPLIKKPNTKDEIHIMVLTLGKKSMCLNVISPDNTVTNQTLGDIEIENKFEQGLGVIKLKNLQSKSGVYRFFATLFDPEIFNPQYIKLYVINEKEVNLFEVPKTHLKETPKHWDIGFIVAPYDHFIEINAPTNKEITKNFYLHQYQNLLNFIRNSKSVDLKTILGFNHRDKLEANGDIFVSRDKIMNSLDKYGYEAKNIEHLFLSAIQPNGLYSFNKLEKKFSTIHPQITFVEGKGNDIESGEDEYLEDFS